jgi:hypothetical protein
MNLDINSSTEIKPLELGSKQLKSHPDSIVCPITCEIMHNPVIDIHGHTFSKEGIAEWLTKHNNTCPINQGEISLNDLRPNLILKEIIGHHLEQGFDLTPRPHDDTIPIPSKVSQKDDIAQSLLKNGKELEHNGNFIDAEKVYVFALQYTCKSEDYAYLPFLFEKKGEIERASSSYLILADLQHTEGKTNQEIDTLKKSIELHSSPFIVERLANLYKVTGQEKLSADLFLDLSQQALYNDDKINALRLCHQSLDIFPGNKETWKILSALQSDPDESIKILFKGANETALSLKERVELCKLIINKDSKNFEAQFHLGELSRLKDKESRLKIKEQVKLLKENAEKTQNFFDMQINKFDEIKFQLLQENSSLKEELRLSKLENFQLTESVALLKLGINQLNQEVGLINSQMNK